MSSSVKVIKGIAWSFASRAGSQLLQLGFLVVLARLVDPDEFGTIGMLVVFTGFAQALAVGGLNAALIHIQDATERHYSTAFWIQIALGVGFSALFFFASPLIAWFYSIPDLEPLTRLTSFIILIQAAGNVQSTRLVKEFDFRKLSMINILATVLSGIAAVGFALHGYGVWALAWQSLAFTAITTGLLWNQAKWRPRFIFDRQAAAELARYGSYLVGFDAVNYWARNLDNLLIGKFLGAHELGIYSRAYQLMMLPISNFSSVIGNVMFPALAEVQTDLPRFKNLYVRATSMIALVTFPAMVGIAVLAEPFILTVFGPKWAEVVPVLKILSLVGLLQSIVHPVGWIFNSLGRTKAQFVLTIVLVPALVIAFIIGVHFGLLGVAIAYAMWSLLDGFLSLHIGGKYLDLPVSDILAGVARIGLMTAFMGILVFGLDSTLFATWSPAVRLFVGVSVGAGSYLALCLLTRDQTFAEINRFIFRSSDRLGTAA
jgi:O-antigen/teichoic acid export membrane protein